MSTTEPLITKVTTINGRYHCRIIDAVTRKVENEMACELRADIGYCMKYMLRMYDKCSGMSLMADASRHRQKGEDRRESVPKGKVWYPSQIPVKK
jgi:hypothetical protein